MRACSSVSSFSLVIAFGLASHARADVVGPPPTDCPSGSVGASTHSGPYCAPADCHTDMDCTGGATCQPMAVCIAQQACGGNGSFVDVGLYPDGGAIPACTVDAMHGFCGVGAICSMGGACPTRTVCYAPPSATPPASGGCRCQVGAREAGGLTVVGLAGLALVIAARRRRR
jgi:MYXO-CTERM domain-containing protein